MKIEIISKNIPATEAMKTFLHQKLEDFVTRAPHVQKILIRLKKENSELQITSEIKVKNQKKPIFVNTRNNSFYSGIQETKDRLKKIFSNRAFSKRKGTFAKRKPLKENLEALALSGY